jgi:hypothetical protein
MSRPTQREKFEIDSGNRVAQSNFDPNKGFRPGSDRDVLFNLMLKKTSIEECSTLFPNKKISKIRWEFGSISIIAGDYYNCIEKNNKVQLIRK